MNLASFVTRESNIVIDVDFGPEGLREYLVFTCEKTNKKIEITRVDLMWYAPDKKEQYPIEVFEEVENDSKETKVLKAIFNNDYGDVLIVTIVEKNAQAT